MRNQIVCWFGSKAALAPEILPEFGPHKAYFEPFAGGMAMLLRKPPCLRETVNDLHQDLTNLARVLAHPIDGAALYRRLSRMLCNEQLHRESRELLEQPFEPGLERAVHYFYVSWMGRMGSIGASTCNSMAHGYKTSSNSCSRKLRAAVESINAWRKRLRDVTITNRDAFTLIDQLGDESGMLIYLDPPYIEKKGKYHFDLRPEDHGRLADAVKRFKKARVIVSYTDHPQLAQLYPPDRWTKRVLVHKSQTNKLAKRGIVKPPEVLLINGPSLSA
ncbi:D12 class N6 adenine-specific DNA methyltransferase (plasmid) [Planctopirus limnophila DSM 3776]|uniref:site-specific DNA-methyltransferase (adenine-specific) n=1 Tax=Planctopirus limnophila (strain ATCC 43296 / DSM 3776 / IFAM 1008 / Mu 290) TaxID=521674 RepID=D5SZG2_PLAL2|nr:DNA adenine methylase [Planctopirus limnophila]ADG70082.1 D12 class N6 adenine-specific DNA methyltransferase [Planctopirus limnophila DSM 3776]